MARKTKGEALRTKQKLLQSALEIMSEKAYSNISMTEIAERAGYSKGAIYWHFKNKNDVLINLVRDTCVSSEVYLTRFMTADEGLEGVRAFFKYKMGIPQQDIKFKMLQKLIHHRHEWPKDVYEKILTIVKARIDKELRTIQTILARMQKSGKIKTEVDTKEIAALISALFQGIFMFQVEDAFYEVDFSKHVDTIFDALEKQIAA